MATKNYGSIFMVDEATAGSTNLLVGSLPGIMKLVNKLVRDAQI